MVYPFKRQFQNANRLATIVKVFARHGFWSVIQRTEIHKDLSPEEQQAASELSSKSEPVQLPVRFRKALEELGPAFVKLGQILAVREDLIPSDYTDELRKLHSNVESLPFSIIQQRLKEDLGEARLNEFESIDERPLAAGSIAQVHLAKLKSGEIVVLKVQRPNIEQQIATDLALMETIAGMLEKYFPELSSLRPRATISALSQALMGELDFIREAGATSKIAKNLQSISYVTVPSVFWNYTTQRVLTLSYHEGFSAWDRDRMTAAGINPSDLVERGLKMFLKMVFVDGMFHGDLHPGNLLITPSKNIVVLDFGMTAMLSRWTRENLAALLVALTREDYERMVQHFLEITEPSPSLNVQAFQSEITNRLAPYVGLRLRQVNSARILWDLAKIAAKYGTPLPQDLVIFIKTLAAFEGLGTRLDPDFDILRLCEEFSSDLVDELYSPKNLQDQALSVARDFASLARHTPVLLRKLMTAATEGHLKIQLGGEDFSRISRALERASSRIAISVIIAALLIGSSLMTFARSQELSSMPVVGTVGFSMAGILGLYIIWSILRGSRF